MLIRDPVKQIIIVDDCEDDFESLSISFDEAGIKSQLKWFEDSNAAVEFFNSFSKNAETEIKKTPSLIILDLNMPGIDGFKVLNLLKQNPKLSHVPVIIFSTSSNYKDVVKSYNEGASTFIQKPVSYKDLEKISKTIRDYWFESAVTP